MEETREKLEKLARTKTQEKVWSGWRRELRDLRELHIKEITKLCQDLERENEELFKKYAIELRTGDILEKLSPSEFELLILDVFRRLGYVVQPTPGSGDRGIDGYIKKENTLGIVQCKQWKGKVPEPVLRDLYGTITKEHADFGYLVTTGELSMPAIEWIKDIEDRPILVIDKYQIASWISGAYETDSSYDVLTPFPWRKDLNEVLRTVKCMKCGSNMRLIYGRRGPFYGCGRYPQCDYLISTLALEKGLVRFRRQVKRR